jgi:uroporphyrinogen decarboxylase
VTARKRVIQALRHKEPGRIPVSLGGSAHKLREGNFFKLLDYFNLDKGESHKELTDGVYTWYHTKLWECLGIDVIYVHMKPPVSIEKWDSLDSLREWGVKCEMRNGWINYTDYPLKDASDLSELSAKLKLPIPNEEARVRGLKEEAKNLYGSTDFAIAAYRPVPFGVFELSQALCGMEKLFEDFYKNPNLVRALFNELLHTQMTFYERQLNEIGEFVHIVEIIDDLGGQANPLISPDLYRKFLKPIHAKLIEFIKAKAPHVKVLLHSCGSVEVFISDFIDIGVDILNPVQPLAKGMDTAKLKEKYGEKICFEGAIDVQQAMRGNIIDVRREVRQRIEDLGSGGGYILGPSHNVEDEIPLGNILALFEEAHRGNQPASV